jgi:hypothetical protein
VHVLYPITGLPNRDLVGLAKRLPYGDAERQRISSQCAKAAWVDGQYYIRTGEDGKEVDDSLLALADELGVGISLRSRLILPKRLLPRLETLLHDGLGENAAVNPKEEAQLLTAAALNLFVKPKEEDEKGKEKTDQLEEADASQIGVTSQPVVLGEQEVEAIAVGLAGLWLEAWKAGGGLPPNPQALVALARGEKQKTKKADKAQDKSNKGKPGRRGKGKEEIPDLLTGAALPEAVVASEAASAPVRYVPDSVKALGEKAAQIVQNFAALRSHCGIDGALFGRFATSPILETVTGCVQVAHLLTVHPIASVADYFSVQDKLQDRSAGETGASHTNTAELASGLFYAHVVVNLAQVAQNFALATSEQRARIVGWLVRTLYQLQPAAKVGSTAPYGAPAEMLVEMGARRPRTLMLAFEAAMDPASGYGVPLSKRATDRMMEYRAEVDRRHGAPRWSERLSKMVAEEGDERPLFEVLASRAEQQALDFFKRLDGKAEADNPTEGASVQAPVPTEAKKAGPAKRRRT